MTFKESLLACIRTEINTIKFLHGKMPAGIMEFRPAEKTRSVAELLRYLLTCPDTPISYFTAPEGTTLRDVAVSQREKAATVPEEDFALAMDEQLAHIEEIFSQLSEEDLLTKTITFPWGTQTALGHGIMETAVKWLAAYKMQYFLYLKMNGVELVTADCWARPYFNEPANA